MPTRREVVDIARSYKGTDFHHQGRLPGVGLDCAGVLICIGRSIGVVPADFDVEPYPLPPDGRTMMALCRKYLIPVSRAAMRPGDAVVVIVDSDSGHPQHLGIVGDYWHGGLSMIHAAMRRGGGGSVIETRLMFSRAMIFKAAFAFPGAV